MSFPHSLTNRVIKPFSINANGIDSFLQAVESAPHGSNWPVVYLLHNENYIDASETSQKLLYIGESTSAVRRMREHFSSSNKNYSERIKLNLAHIIFDESFNKSAILDIEQELIHMFGADSSNYTLQNKNDGQSTQHQYYERDKYIESLREIWEDLRKPDINLAKDSFEDVRNSNLFKYSPYTALTEEQERVCDDILDNLLSSLKNGTKSNAIVKGTAGTGKTVVLIKVLSELVYLSNKIKSANVLPSEAIETFGFDDDVTDEAVEDRRVKNAERIRLLKSVRPYGLKVAYVVPLSELQKPFQKVIKAVCGDAGIVKSATQIANDPEIYDVIFVDEGHRLGTINKFGANKDPYKQACEAVCMTYSQGMSNPPTELDWLIRKTDNCVFVYDKDQKVRSHKSISHCLFKSLILDKTYTTEYELKKQMRCKAGDNYVKFINDLFSNNIGSQANCPPWKGYDLRVYDDVGKMVDDINRHNDAGGCGLSRTVAGYGWKWVTNGKNRDVIKAMPEDKWDIHIGGHSYFWNAQNGNFIFSADKNEIGCVHTVQGFDLNYVGIIFGPEIGYDSKRGFVVNPQYLYDSGAKTKDKQELLELTIRAYKVMMERGILGCYVYACDPALQEYLKSCIPSESAARENIDMNVGECIYQLTGITVSSGGRSISNEIELRKADVDNLLKGQNADIQSIILIRIDGNDYYVTQKRCSVDSEYYIFNIVDSI